MTFWSQISTEFVFPDLQIQCFHQLTHPEIGEAAGTKRNRIQLEGVERSQTLRLKGNIGCRKPSPFTTYVRARLTQGGPALPGPFRKFGRLAQLKGIDRLVSFSEQGLQDAFFEVMSKIQGVYLPVPDAWKNQQGKRNLTPAKALALLSKLTSIPLQDLERFDKEVRNPSHSTVNRMKQDLISAIDQLNPMPVSDILVPDRAASFTEKQPYTSDHKIDPEVEQIYG